jgi:hypothetical protein
MGIQSYLIDEDALARMILGYRESELKLPGFETRSVTRGVNQVDWQFVREVEKPETLDGFFGCFDVNRLIRFWCVPPLELEKGDSVVFHYWLKWFWEGGNEHPGQPLPEVKLTFEFGLAS